MADASMNEGLWDPPANPVTKGQMILRIKAAVSQRGWCEAARIFSERGESINGLKVVEVGCGTGTLALSFCLMGAQATLVDCNEKALSAAAKIWEDFGCDASFIRGDCLKQMPEELAGKYDLVISSGLAEHFLKDDRRRCLDYHRRLARDGGVVYICVPNRLSPFYWCVRLVRKLTGSWKIDVECPYSRGELLDLARRDGLKNPYVIGYTVLWKDAIDFFYGIRSAIADSLNDRFKKVLKELCAGRVNPHRRIAASVNIDIRKYCADRVVSLQGDGCKRATSRLADIFCSNLVLFAIK